MWYRGSAVGQAASILVGSEVVRFLPFLADIFVCSFSITFDISFLIPFPCFGHARMQLLVVVGGVETNS